MADGALIDDGARSRERRWTGARSRTAELRHLLLSPSLSFLMEAHNGLSARIAEEAGFPGIWASGLSISASLGVRDNNEASWTQGGVTGRAARYRANQATRHAGPRLRRVPRAGTPESRH